MPGGGSGQGVPLPPQVMQGLVATLVAQAQQQAHQQAEQHAHQHPQGRIMFVLHHGQKSVEI